MWHRGIVLFFLRVVLLCQAGERRPWTQGWRACRLREDEDPAQGCRSSHRRRPWNVTALPTTAVRELWEQNPPPTTAASTRTAANEWLFTSRHLQEIPDVSDTGRAYYTLIYEFDLTAAPIASPSPQQLRLPPTDTDNTSSVTDTTTTTTTIEFAGVNYRTRAYVDGVVVPELYSSTTTTDGMFQRRWYDVSTTATANNVTTRPQWFHIVVEPPPHGGTCRTTSSSSCQGQGGNHALAQDGPTAQYLLGWDWIPSMPDRATGFFGGVQREIFPHGGGHWAIRNVAVETRRIDQNGTTTPLYHGNHTASIRFTIHYTLVGLRRDLSSPSPTRLDNTTMVLTADWGESWTWSNHHDLHQQHQQHSSSILHFQHTVVVQNPHKLQWWWPHGMVPTGNEAHLHQFNLSLWGENDTLQDRVTVDVGIRTVTTQLDPVTQGQLFWINGRRLYLVGGNWIGTDPTMTYSASTSRYCHELALHKHAGLNLLRVWGGGTAERDEFYACADRLGLLVYQEFWMTGDNNGRWAGNYSWPLDHGTYLSNVKDTILRLRNHPSLLFYGGCNECLAPKGLHNPPRDIDNGIRKLLEQYDPRRFYISSSMSGENVADDFHFPEQWFNRSYSLSFADGPYGMLMPPSFFERNPGLKYKNISIGFQPEIGSTAAPTYHGLLKFMNSSEAEMGFPRRNAPNVVGDTWQFHRFQPWTTRIGNTSRSYDHVYAYFHADQSVRAKDWCAAAQLAAHVQYQNLFNGFVSHMFEYTTAVIMWKSQSPWPSLRGFLYDWYLETTGGLRGTQASLGHPLSVTLDASNWRIRMINRLGFSIGGSSSVEFACKFEWITLQGNIVFANEIRHQQSTLPAMSTTLLGDESDGLSWPIECSDVCFLRLSVIARIGDRNRTLGRPMWHWLTPPDLDNYGRLGSNFSALGLLRQRQGVIPTLEIHSCDLLPDAGFVVDVEIHVDGHDVLFYPTWTVHSNSGRQILPIFDKEETDVVLLPQKSYRRILTSSTSVFSNTLQVGLESWNAQFVSETVICTRPTHSQAQHDQ